MKKKETRKLPMRITVGNRLRLRVAKVTATVATHNAIPPRQIRRQPAPPRPLSVLFFVFQAEHGIRVPLVTGVQTCALPICVSGRVGRGRTGGAGGVRLVRRGGGAGRRSEERRVGKEGRSRWSPYH